MKNGTRRHPVLVTGVGPFTSIGCGATAFWGALMEGRTSARSIRFPWKDHQPFKTLIGAPVPQPAPADCNITTKEAALLDPTACFTLAAMKLALDDAGLATELVNSKKNRHRIPALDANRVGVVLGTGIGGLYSVEVAHTAHANHRPFVGPLRYSLPKLIPNAIPGQVAIKYGLHGECKTVVTACAAGTMALGDAYRLVRDGELDLVITGGVDNILSTSDGFGLYGFDVLRTLSTRNDDPAAASRPFDRDRDGFVLGEGAGVMVLESESHASARGATPYARILGYGTSCDAHSMMQLHPSGDQMVRSMELAIASADISHSDIGYVNAHGTSTRLNDPMEARALHRVFGPMTRNVLVNSTKSMIGHGIGAAGGIEAIVTALSLARGMVHSCVNLDHPDPKCDLNLPRRNAPLKPCAALSNSFGFGGHNATLVLGPA